VGKVRAVQPRGPYLLGGMCAGGVIAFEMARQLQSQGERVAMVALLDAADVAAPLKAWRMAGQRLRRFSGVFHGGGRDRPARRLTQMLGMALKKASNTGTYVVGQYLKRARDAARLRLFRAHLDRGRPLPGPLRTIPLRTVYLFAERDYHPAGRFDGELALFRASGGIGTDSDEPYVDRYEDPLLGWDRRASRGVRVFDVPGGHSSMLQEPHVEALADLLQTYIDEVLADEPAARPRPALS
jgi:thioesterase domain-containing protein